jgi:hypothetical protein
MVEKQELRTIVSAFKVGCSERIRPCSACTLSVGVTVQTYSELVKAEWINMAYHSALLSYVILVGTS